MSMKKSLFALSLGTFALGIAEFLMMGILGTLANDLDISVTKCGHLISAYALGVCAGAPALLFARKMQLKRLMLILAALIALGNLCASFAPGFWTLFASRFISGLPHGAYFGVGAIVARRLAAPGKEVQAVSIMIAGMTVATLAGVPLGTFLTNNFTWRVAFLIVALAGAATFVTIRFWVPDVGSLKPVSFMGQFRFLATLPPWLIFGGVIFGQTGLYCWYSYIDPLLTDVSGFPTSSLPWLMVVGGAGMLVGNLVCGQLGVRYKPSAVAATVQAMGIVVLVMVYFLAGVQWLMVGLLFLGTAILFGSGSPLQSSIVGYSKGGEMLGAACIQIAYNAGNAIAAWIGGVGISYSHDYRLPSLIGLPLIAIGCLLLYILYYRNERDKQPVGR